MTASVSSPADVVNLALARIGFKQRINDLHEGTPAAEKALDVYAQTRDDVLGSGDWNFAMRDVALVPLRAAPPGGYVAGITPWSNAYPALPWLFSYAYPGDCLKARAVKPVPMFRVNMNPQPNRFTVDNDPLLKVRVILSNVPDAVLTYAAQITDPALWDSGFVEALSAALGRRLAPTLIGPASERTRAADEAQTKQNARTEQG